MVRQRVGLSGSALFEKALKGVPMRQSLEPIIQLCFLLFLKKYMSRDMRFPTMWYVRPAKA